MPRAAAAPAEADAVEAADTDAEAGANVGVAMVKAAEAAALAAAGTPAARRRARAPRAAATPRRRAAAATPADWAAGEGRRMICSRTARSLRLSPAAEGWGECVVGGWDGRVGARRVMCSLVPFSPQAYARGCSLRFAPSLMFCLFCSVAFICSSFLVWHAPRLFVALCALFNGGSEGRRLFYKEIWPP